MLPDSRKYIVVWNTRNILHIVTTAREKRIRL